MNTDADLKVALQAEFVRRCKLNRAYSLRAFAKFLEMDQSLLSKIMRSERRPSARVKARVRAKLGLAGMPAALPAHDFLPLPEDEFNFIADWYHFAILELLKTKRFKFSPANVAKRLGLHVTEAQAAIDRLTRLGLIRVDKDKARVNSRGNTWSNTAATTEARRLLQKQLLSLGIEAIETIPFDKRDSGSLTVAINKRKLPEFKERLRQIRFELGQYFQPDGTTDADEVYQLVVSFFPLTK